MTNYTISDKELIIKTDPQTKFYENGDTVYYSFPVQSLYDEYLGHFSDESSASFINRNFDSLLTNQSIVSSVREIFSLIGQVTNLTFVEIPDNDVVSIPDAAGPVIRLSFADAYFPGSAPSAQTLSAIAPVSNQGINDIFIPTLFSDQDAHPGGNLYTILLHEIGHTLYLKHANRYHAGDNTPPPYIGGRDSPLISTQYNLPTQIFPITPMLLDIAALQDLYGVPSGADDLSSGNDTYTFLMDDPPNLIFGNQRNVIYGNQVKTIWDSNGTDTFDASAYSIPVHINLGEAHRTIGDRPCFF